MFHESHNKMIIDITIVFMHMCNNNFYVYEYHLHELLYMLMSTIYIKILLLYMLMSTINEYHLHKNYC